MMKRFTAWLLPDLFPVPEVDQWRASVFNKLLLSLTLVAGLISTIGVVFIFSEKFWTLSIGLSVTALSCAAIVLNRKGHIRLAGLVVGFIYWASSTAFITISGGIFSIDIIFYLPGVVAIGIALGTRATWVYSGIIFLTITIFLYLALAAVPLPRLFPFPPLSVFVLITLCLALIALPLTVTLNSLDHAVQRARQNELRYRSLLENIPAITVISDFGNDFTLLYVSRQVQKLLGYHPQEFLSEPHLWEHLLHPDDRGNVAAAIQRAAQLKLPFVLDYRVKARDGQILWLNDRGELIHDPMTKKLEWLRVWSDITSRKQADEEIRTLNASLEQRVAERTAELEAANKELEAFSYSVSHDLRAPLRAILGYASILTQDTAPAPDPQAQALLTRLVDSGQKMNRLIDGLLNISRMERKPLHKSSVNLNEIVHQVIENLLSETELRRVEWVIEELPAATADPTLLQQVYANLLGNAIKYTRGSPDTQIEVGSQINGTNKPIYYVRDNGVGFDMQYADKLFGVFQRLHSESEFEGDGIGLATVQRIINRHGGRIWAESTINQGATFYFTLE
jgi:PAS domain S-box-containing protein